MRIFKIILSAYREDTTKNMSESSIKSDITLKATAALLMSAASALLLFLNIVNSYWFMAGTTGILFIGFALCAVLCGKFKYRSATVIIMAILVGLLFSIYAIFGENEGFAILWILIVPPIGMNLLGIRVGTVLSAYFQLLLMTMFYTPLREYTSDFYTSTFCIRFPLLYLTSFAAAVLLTAQKDFYFRKTEDMAFIDILTGLYNRRYYDSIIRRIVEAGRTQDLTLISIDINRLKYTNDTFGHGVGDKLIVTASALMSECLYDAEAVCRIGGDEFMAVSFSPVSRINTQLDDLIKKAAAVQEEHIPGISLSIGLACHADLPDVDISGLEKAADQAMYKSKSKFYIETGIERRR